MKALPFTLILILAIGLVGNAQPVSAQAYGIPFTTTLIYQNPTTGLATRVQLIYYPDPNTKNPIIIPRPDLPGGKSTSVFIGTIDQAFMGFHGTTYIQSDPSLVSIQQQTAEANSPIKVRPITNLPLYGSPTIWITSVLRNEFYANTIFSFQNTDSQVNIIHLDLYNIKASLVYSTAMMLEPGEIYTFDAGDEQNNSLPRRFNGSAVLIATRLDRKTPGKIIGSALELDNKYWGAKSFEGIGHGSVEVFMPSAVCNFDMGAGVLVNSAYAVQNNDLYSSGVVTAIYSNGRSQAQTVGPGSKASFVTCQADKMPTGYMGSAIIRSTTPITVIGKVYGGGLSTAFTGTPAGSGTKNLALPYVRWVDEQNWYNGTQARTFITIQNVGPDTIRGKIHAYFFPCHGDVISHEIPLGDDGLVPGAKLVLKPSDAYIDQFGACEKGPQVGGSAIIAGPENSQLSAVVRVQQWDPAHGIVVGEDYNGVNAP